MLSRHRIVVMKEIKMTSPDIHPKWWQLYLICPLLITLFVLDARIKISARGHQAIQIGVVLFVWGLIHVWLKANASALSKMDQRQYYGTITVIQVPISQLPEAGEPRDAMVDLSTSEVKNVLREAF